jgi:DNA-binding MarR family transcriptional regulator
VARKPRLSSEMDSFDAVLTRWQAELPGVDLTALAVAARINRLALIMTAKLEERLRPFAIGPGDMDVIFCLLNSGQPYELRPSDLSRGCYVTSGATTGRLDRLAITGLIERRPSPDDRRALLVRLTPKGVSLGRKLQRFIASQSTLSRVLDELPAGQCQSLVASLRHLTAHLEKTVDIEGLSRESEPIKAKAAARPGVDYDEQPKSGQFRTSSRYR